MKYEIRILPSAWEDLKQIEDFYRVQFGEQTALKVINHILDVIERLEQFPESGSLIPDLWLNDQDFRMIICQRHVALYREIENVVYIYHVVDTRTQYTKLFYGQILDISEEPE